MTGMNDREKLETWLSSALDAVLVETGMKFKPAAEKRIARDLALAILASDWLREVRGWRPWGDAPEDGSEILVYRSDAGVFMAHFVPDDWYLASQDNPPEGDELWFSTCGEDLSGDLPTHWHPLPAPPASAEGEAHCHE